MSVHSSPSRSQRLARASWLSCLVMFGLMIGCGDEGATAGERDGDPAMTAIDAFIKENPIDRLKAKWRTKVPKPPAVRFDPNKTYTWKLVTTEGDILLKMRTDVAPKHVASTFYLTRLGFYDGLAFHRVLKGFMAQGGDPLGNGSGGPAYKYAGEFDPSATHDGPGVLSMANAGPGTDGSQFFITFRATPSLDNKHTVFGKAEDAESLATIKKIEALGKTREPARPNPPIKITRATILIE